MDVQKSFSDAMAELEKLLDSKTVVGAPVDVGGATIVPLVTMGFGFGAGGGTGNGNEGKGTGGFTAGGGGIKPVAVLISDKNGVRVEPLTTASSVVGKVAETVSEIVKTTVEKQVGTDKALAKPDDKG